jgi:hypothetical protein
MSIRALAIELYKAQQKVHKLQDQLEVAGINKKDQLRQELKQAEAERNQLRRIIEAEKEPYPLRDNKIKHR